MIEDWIRARDWLLPALALNGGTHTEDDIVAGLYVGRYHLWIAERGAIVTEFVTYPRLKALNFFLVGGNLEAVLALEPGIVAFARENGCKRVICAGRKGWERVLKDYAPAWLGLRKDI